MRADCTESKRVTYTDFLAALWVTITGLLFLLPLMGAALGYELFASLGTELWALGNYVYIVVLVVILTAFALRAVRRFGRKQDVGA